MFINFLICLLFSFRYEKKRSNIAKEIKSLFDTMHNLCNDERQMLEELNFLSAYENLELQEILGSLKEFMDDLGKNRQDYAKLVRSTSLEPLSKFETGFKEMKVAIKRYEELTEKTEKLHQKVSKYTKLERTAKNLMKLKEYEDSLKTSKKEFTDLRILLDKELHKFLQFRLDYLQPSVSSFISAEILSSGNCFGSLNHFEALQVGNEISIEDLNKQNALFSQIDKLKIVGA